MPAKSVGSGWLSLTSQEAWAWSSRCSWASGSNLAIASATSRSVITGPQAAVGAGGEPVVDPPGAGQREGVGLLGDPAGLPGRHLQPAYPFPQQREPVAQVEGVADQLGARGRGDAELERRRSRG